MKFFRSILRSACTGVPAVFMLSTLVLVGIQGASADVTVDHATQSVLVVADGNAIRLQPWSAGTIRVEAAPGQTIPAKQSLAVIAAPNASGWDVQETDDNVSLKGPRMTAVVDKKTGLVSFLDASGKTLLQQSAWTFSPAKDPARDGLNVGASFHRSPGEHFYGGGVVNELRQPTAHLELSNGNNRLASARSHRVRRQTHSKATEPLDFSRIDQWRLATTSELLAREFLQDAITEFTVPGGKGFQTDPPP